MGFPIVTFGFIDNIHELMEVSDIIITKSGGIVCAEALVKDLPIVAMSPIPGQEANNLSILLKNEVGYRLKEIGDVKKILKDLYTRKDDLARIRMKIANVKKPDAASNIAKLAIEKIGRHKSDTLDYRDY